MEFEGDNAVFDNVVFRDNGWGKRMYPAGGAWSDGLTVWDSSGLVIRNSKFVDNSDIDLILGGAPNAVIENNTLGNTYNFAFGTLMLDNFHRAYAGDYSGMVIRNNTIECGQGFCGIGIEIGGNLWGGGDASAVSGAKIIANTIEGSVQGIMSDGHVSNTEVANKKWPFTDEPC